MSTDLMHPVLIRRILKMDGKIKDYSYKDIVIRKFEFVAKTKFLSPNFYVTLKNYHKISQPKIFVKFSLKRDKEFELQNLQN